MDYARLGDVASDGRVGDRLEVDSLDHCDDITRTGISGLCERLGLPTLFRCYRAWHVDSLCSPLAQTVARRPKPDHSRRVGLSGRFYSSTGHRLLSAGSLM